MGDSCASRELKPGSAHTQRYTAARKGVCRKSSYLGMSLWYAEKNLNNNLMVIMFFKLNIICPDSDHTEKLSSQ